MSPVTAREFRRIALGMAGAVEGAHMGHPDFRVGGRIFASLHPGRQRGMVTLTPAQQADVIRDHPAGFEPESGAWGRAGCTRVWFARVDEESLGHALTMASRNQKGPRTEAPVAKPRAAVARAQVRGVGWKRATTIDGGKFARMSNAILESLTTQPVTFTELTRRVKAKLEGFEGSIPWYTITVARELEVQGRLIRHDRPVRYSRPPARTRRT